MKLLLLATCQLVLIGAMGTVCGCKPPGGAPVQPPPGVDLTCRTTGDGYAWEGSAPLETGLDDLDVTVFVTGRALVELAGEAGIVWDSFLAQNGHGFADDVYGHGAYLRDDVKLTKVSDSQVVVNDGGTLRLYTLVDKGVYESAEQDSSRLTFRSDGTAQLKLAPQVYEIFAMTSLVSAASNNSPVQIVSAICPEPACTSAHTTIASDSTGRIQSVTDALGYARSYKYDGGRLQSVTFPDERVETFGYDASGNLATIAYPPLTLGGPPPTRTYTYVGWKLATAQGPGGSMAMPSATFTFADSGQLTSLEPTDHDTTTVTVQSDAPQPGYTTMTLTDRTHLPGTNPVVMIDDACANVQDVDSMKYGQTIARDAHHQPTGVSDPDDPSKLEEQIENPDTARDRWGDIHGTIDDELGEKFVFSPSDEDGMEGRAPSSFSGPEGSGSIRYAKDDPTITNLPAWAVDLVSDETWTTSVVDDTGAKNTLVAGSRRTFADTGNASCPRQIIDTDKLTGLSETSCFSADGSKVLSFTDGYGERTTIEQTDNPQVGESVTVTLPNGEVVTEMFDPEGRLLQSATMGFNDDEVIVRYANGMPQVDRFPGVKVTGSSGGTGYQRADLVDPETLLETSDEDEDGAQEVDEDDYAYYPEGIPREMDINFAM
ncbi:MAG TPA: RHS repeat domain-containing protein, partial [Polyangiaceae bacterium]